MNTKLPVTERVKKRLELAKTDQGVYANHYREDAAALLAEVEELQARLDALASNGITCERITRLEIYDEKEKALYGSPKFLIRVKK